MTSDDNDNNSSEINQMLHIGEVGKRLWSDGRVADHLRANSNFSSNEYFLPVMPPKAMFGRSWL